MNWSDEMFKTCKRMWEEGFRREDIAHKIGVTPNAVSGMVHRRKWERLMSVKDREVLSETSVEEKPKASIIERVESARPIQLIMPISEAKVITRQWVTKTSDPRLKEVISNKAKVWTHRVRGECAYPVGSPDRPANQDYCCNKTENEEEYCSGHMTIMFPPHIQRSKKKAGG